MAIIPGEGKWALSLDLIASLEVKFSQKEGTALVERSQIRKIWQEMDLAGTGMIHEA